MSTLGFDNYVEPLKLYLQKYREAMKGDKHTEGFEDINEVLRKYKENRRHVSLKYRDFYITAILKLLFALTAFRRFSNSEILSYRVTLLDLKLRSSKVAFQQYHEQ